MQQYKIDFIEFLLESRALQFGNFTLKSGRVSPFFINTGCFTSGEQLQKLGNYYAKAIYEHYKTDFDILFGPAYKAIPLAVACSISMKELFDADIKYCANRKEAKDHGDKGVFLGETPHNGSRIVIVEDVTTSGKSINETYPLLRSQANVDIVGLMVSIDRMEVGSNGMQKALSEIEMNYGFETNSIVTMQEIIDYLCSASNTSRIKLDDKTICAINDYYSQYGVKEQ